MDQVNVLRMTRLRWADSVAGLNKLFHQIGSVLTGHVGGKLVRMSRRDDI